MDPYPRGSPPPYPRPIFSSLPPPPFFLFFSGTPAQNSYFLPPPPAQLISTPPPIFRQKPPYPRPPPPNPRAPVPLYIWCQKSGKIFIAQMYKLFIRYTVISYVYRSLIPKKKNY